MANRGRIFKIGASVEEDRPVIDFDAPCNQSNDWQRLDAILLGNRPDRDYLGISVAVNCPDATFWGFYSIPGTLGLISAIAVQQIGVSAFRDFKLFEAKLNDAAYFFLKCTATLPCLDMAKSEVITFHSNPNRIKQINKYSFDLDMISDPVVFCIPEFVGLFGTESIFKSVSDNEIPGFSFTPVS